MLALRRGLAALRARRARALLGARLVGLLLPGRQRGRLRRRAARPSGLAALLIASIPLWVILLRRVDAASAIRARASARVLVGFAGVALLLRPGEQSGDATLARAARLRRRRGDVGVRLVRLAALSLPRDPLVSTGWQMLLGGIAMPGRGGCSRGEAADVDSRAFSARSLLGARLPDRHRLAGRASRAYAWLLQNAPISKVSTYAYVNPVVAIVLGWLILDEVVAPHDARRRGDHRRRASRSPCAASDEFPLPRQSLRA